MGHAPAKKGRWAFKEQTGFGTPETSFAATDVVECEVMLPQTPREALQADVMKVGYYESPIHPGSRAGGAIPVVTLLHGWMPQDDLGSDPSADPTSHPDALLMKLAMGAALIGGYNAAVNAATGATAIGVSAGFDANLVGCAINVPLASGGRDVVWVKTATDGGGGAGTYTFDLPASGNVADTGTIFGSHTVYVPRTHTTPANGLTAQWLGTDASAQVRLWDAIANSMALTMDPKTQPKLEVGCITTNWTPVGSGGAPAPAKYAYGQLPALVGSQGARLRLDGSSFAVRSFKLELEIDTEPIDDTNADEGVAQYVVTDRRVKLTVTTLKSAFGTLQAPGDLGGSLQLDSAVEAGRMFSLRMSAPVVKEQEQLVVAGNVIGVTTVYGMDLPTVDSGSTPAANSGLAGAFL